jgi:hypothetical protein
VSQSVSVRGKSSKGTVNGLFEEKQGVSTTSQSSPSLMRKPLSPISLEKLPPSETNVNSNNNNNNNNNTKKGQSKNLNQINFLSPRISQKKSDQETNKIFEELEQELDVEFQTGTFSKSNSSLSLEKSNSPQPVPKTCKFLFLFNERIYYFP